MSMRMGFTSAVCVRGPRGCRRRGRARSGGRGRPRPTRSQGPPPPPTAWPRRSGAGASATRVRSRRRRPRAAARAACPGSGRRGASWPWRRHRSPPSSKATAATAAGSRARCSRGFRARPGCSRAQTGNRAGTTATAPEAGRTASPAGACRCARRLAQGRRRPSGRDRAGRPGSSPQDSRRHARTAKLALMTASTPAERRTRAMRLPPLRDADARAIDAFIDAWWAESGAARQTLDGYRRDLQGFARWRDRGDIAAAGRDDLFDYLAWRSREGYSPRSNARLLSALRAFYGWRVRQGRRADDPTALLEPPKLPRLLPRALAESEIDRLLAAPDTAGPEGLRDRAMLELMYACGLRVSELVGLPATAVNLRQGVLPVLGKGGKEPAAPLGEEAQHWLERYLSGARPALAGGQAPVELFLGPRAAPLSRQGFWALVKR